MFSPILISFPVCFLFNYRLCFFSFYFSPTVFYILKEVITVNSSEVTFLNKKIVVKNARRNKKQPNKKEMFNPFDLLYCCTSILMILCMLLLHFHPVLFFLLPFELDCCFSLQLSSLIDYIVHFHFFFVLFHYSAVFIFCNHISILLTIICFILMLFYNIAHVSNRLLR